MKRRLTATLLISAMVLSIAGILFMYYRFDPAENILFPKCIFHALTGLECPGCGSQRAIHQILSGNIVEALKYNALVVAAIPYLFLWAGLYLWQKLTKNSKSKEHVRHIYDIMYHGNAVYIILSAVIIFWVVRNFSPFF